MNLYVYLFELHSEPDMLYNLIDYDTGDNVAIDCEHYREWCHQYEVIRSIFSIQRIDNEPRVCFDIYIRKIICD